LRSEWDRQAVLEGLADGTLDTIACDHAPHSVMEKDVEFADAAFGLIGLETSLGLSLRLVHEGFLSLGQLIAKMSTHPARILRLPGGTLTPGSPADVTVIDLNREWTVDASRFASKSRNCPFQGWNLKGRAIMTINEGRVTYSS
jgi:dihydroorotase